MKIPIKTRLGMWIAVLAVLIALVSLSSAATTSIYGNKVVFDRYNDIYLYDISTGAIRKITSDASVQSDPFISGSKIVWDDTRLGYHEIYMCDLNLDGSPGGCLPYDAKTRVSFDTNYKYSLSIGNNWILWESGSYQNYNLNAYGLGPDGLYGTADDQGLVNMFSAKTSHLYANIDKSGTRVVYINTGIYVCDLSLNGQTGGCLPSDTKTITIASSSYSSTPSISGNIVVWEVWGTGYNYVYTCDLGVHPTGCSADLSYRTYIGDSYQPVKGFALSGSNVIYADYAYSVYLNSWPKISSTSGWYPDADGNYVVWEEHDSERTYLYTLPSGPETLIISDCLDLDGDGYPETQCGGNDCDDDPTDDAMQYTGPAAGLTASYINPGATEICDNGVSDDCDVDVDCNDADCAGDAACAVCDATETSCTDGKDNDCDTLFDCDDPDCAGDAACPTCSDGIQNQDETGIDCGGTVCPACAATEECGNNLIEGTEACDGSDLGGETCISQGFTSGTLSCMADCSGFDTSACSAENQCSDGIDNDGNGCADYPTDSGCYGLNDSTESGGICPVLPTDESDDDFTICHSDDSDNDGICNKFDNCWSSPNPNQTDTDGDCGDRKSDPAYWNSTSRSWIKDPKCGDGCVCAVPYDDMEIFDDTLLCKGTYGVSDAMQDGVIKIKASGTPSDYLTLDCNDAVVRTEFRCNLYGDANGNGVFDYEDVYVIYLEYRKSLNFDDPSDMKFDACGDDYDRNDVLDEGDYGGVSSNVDCSGRIPGDLNFNGIIDGQDIIIFERLYRNTDLTKDMGCWDFNGDGIIGAEDAHDMGDEITNTLVTNITYIPEGNIVTGTCERFNSSTGGYDIYPAGDLNNDHIVDFNDLIVANSYIVFGSSYQNPCGDMDGDGYVTGSDMTTLMNYIIKFPAPCLIKGDINHNGVLDAADFYLLTEMADQASFFWDINCGNVYSGDDNVLVCKDPVTGKVLRQHLAECGECPDDYPLFVRCNNYPTINDNDVNAFLAKYGARVGIGIEVDGVDNVELKNCNFYNYSYGIQVNNSDNDLFHNNEFYSMKNDIYFDNQSDGTELYLNHLYLTGVNVEEHTCNAGDTCNDYCNDSMGNYGKGNLYGEEVGIIKNIAVSGVKVLDTPEGVGHDDCGVIEITNPEPGEQLPQQTVNIKFTKQDSKDEPPLPVTYYLDYMIEGGSWENIAQFNDDDSDCQLGGCGYLWHNPFDYQQLTLRITPFDGFLNGTPSMIGFGVDMRGNVKGYVKCCDEHGVCNKVPYATVYSGNSSTTADAEGYYLLKDVRSGTNVMITAANSTRRSQRTYVEEVLPQDTVSENFTDVCPITIDCNSDCTVKGTETEAYPICDPRCDGVSDCVIFRDEGTGESCEYAAKGSTIEYTKEVDDGTGNPVEKTFRTTCCSGPEEEIVPEEQESKIQVDADNIARTTRIVNYNGRPVKMVIVTWD